MQEANVGQFNLRWSIGGNYVNAVAEAPIFLLTDPADDPAARVFSRRLLDGFGALARSTPDIEADQIRRVWDDAMMAAEEDLATITMMATDADLPTPEVHAALLAVVKDPAADGQWSWLVHISGDLVILFHDDDTVLPKRGEFTFVPLSYGDRFVLVTRALRTFHSASRITNVVSQLPRAQRAAAVLVANTPEHKRDESTALVVDVHDSASIAALEFPETLLPGDLQEEPAVDDSMSADWALKALGFGESARKDPGRRLTPPELDDFVFVSYLGSGGFADVFVYEEQTPKRLVAIKVLRSGQERSRRADFRAEIDVMGQLGGHPSIVSIYDADVTATGQPYIVMQYCPGASLAERLIDGPLPITDLLRIGVQLCSAVHTAHMLGIVHYDIKPSNVLASEFGRYQLGDFGIAALVGTSGTEVAGMSLPWAAPEALRGQECTHLADVYSVGATLFTALYGRAPFAGKGLGRTAYIERALEEEIHYADIDGLSPDIQETLTATLRGALEREQANRTPSVADIGRSLQAIQQALGEPVTELEIPAS